MTIHVLYLLYKVPPKLSRSQLSSPGWSNQVATTPASASGTDLKEEAGDTLLKDYKIQEDNKKWYTMLGNEEKSEERGES